MAFIQTWSSKWEVRARNKATGNIIRFVRENHLTPFYTRVECESWCERNGYELIEIHSVNDGE